MKSTPQMLSPKSKFLANNTKQEKYNLPIIPSYSKNKNMTHSKQPFMKGNKSGKLNTIDSGSLGNRSSYMSTIKDLTGNVEYDEMNVEKVHHEQKRLKGILKKINADTVKLIENITPKDIKQSMQRKHNKSEQQINSFLEVKCQQFVNNEKIMDICQKQIKKLQQRMQGIVGADKNYYARKIKQTTQEIDIISGQINQMKWQNYKRGKNIVKQENSQGQTMLRLQYENQILQQKVGRLRRDNQKIDNETKVIENKMQEVQPQFLKAQSYFKGDLKQKNQRQKEVKTKQHQYLERKGQIDILKKKHDFHVQNSQFKYFHLLKTIEQVSEHVTADQYKISDFEGRIIFGKQYIEKLQKQLKQIKALKMKKQYQVNQFLKNSKVSNFEGDSNNPGDTFRTNKIQKKRGQTLTPIQNSSRGEKQENNNKRYQTISQKVPQMDYSNIVSEKQKKGFNQQDQYVIDQQVAQKIGEQS